MELFLISGACVLVGFIAGAFFMHHYLHPGETLVQAATEVEAAVVAEAGSRMTRASTPPEKIARAK